MGQMSIVDKIATGLIVVGGLNWGVKGISLLVGQDWDLVTWLAGVTRQPAIAPVAFVLVGAAAVWALVKFPWDD